MWAWACFNGPDSLIPCRANPNASAKVLVRQGLGEGDAAWIWSPITGPSFSRQQCDECVGCSAQRRWAHSADVLLQVCLPRGQILFLDPIIRTLYNIIYGPRCLKYPRRFPNASVLASEELVPGRWTSPCRRWSFLVGLGGGSIQTLQKLPSVSQSNSVLQRAALFIVVFSTHDVREPEVFADSILYIHTLWNSGGCSQLCKSPEAAKLGQDSPENRSSRGRAPSKLLGLPASKVDLAMRWSAAKKKKK